MKTLLLSVLAAMLMLTLVSCGQDEAYRRGATDAIRELQIHVQQTKQQLMGQLQPKLLVGAVIVLLLTFFGDSIIERIREELVVKLQLMPDRQAILLSGGYLLLCAGLSIWSLYRGGPDWSLPLLSCIHIGYLLSLPNNSPNGSDFCLLFDHWRCLVPVVFFNKMNYS